MDPTRRDVSGRTLKTPTSNMILGVRLRPTMPQSGLVEFDLRLPIRNASESHSNGSEGQMEWLRTRPDSGSERSSNPNMTSRESPLGCLSESERLSIVEASSDSKGLGDSHCLHDTRKAKQAKTVRVRNYNSGETRVGFYQMGMNGEKIVPYTSRALATTILG